MALNFVTLFCRPYFFPLIRVPSQAQQDKWNTKKYHTHGTSNVECQLIRARFVRDEACQLKRGATISTR